MEASANIRIGPPGTISQCEPIHSNVYISLNSSKVVDGAYSDKYLTESMDEYLTDSLDEYVSDT